MKHTVESGQKSDVMIRKVYLDNLYHPNKYKQINSHRALQIPFILFSPSTEGCLVSFLYENKMVVCYAVINQLSHPTLFCELQ